MQKWRLYDDHEFQSISLLCCVAAWDPCWITKLNHKRGRMQCYQKVWHIKLYDFYRPLSSYGPSFGQNTFCMNCLYLKVKPDVFSATSNGQNIISDVRKNLHIWLNYTKNLWNITLSSTESFFCLEMRDLKST